MAGHELCHGPGQRKAPEELQLRFRGRQCQATEGTIMQITQRIQEDH